MFAVWSRADLARGYWVSEVFRGLASRILYGPRTNAGGFPASRALGPVVSALLGR
jgi:hypothetical protein